MKIKNHSFHRHQKHIFFFGHRIKACIKLDHKGPTNTRTGQQPNLQHKQTSITIGNKDKMCYCQPTIKQNTTETKRQKP